MRIISGKYKKSNLYLPKSINFRPTSDFVKESLFSVISNYIQGSLFLDLFSGSGNIGIEALSRGALKVFFVDNSLKSIKILKKNLQLLDIHNNLFKILRMDYKKAIQRFFNDKIFFDVIFADPPYQKDYCKNLIEIVSDFNILKEGGLFIIEHSKRENFNIKLKELVLFKILEYGDTKITILMRG